MFGVIREYRRRKVLAGLGNRGGQRCILRNLRDVKSAGFCFVLQGAADVEALGQIVHAMEQLGIPFGGIVLEMKKSFPDEASREEFRNTLNTRSTSTPHSISNCCNLLLIGKNELNWIGLPGDQVRAGQLEEFLQRHFDLFVFLGGGASSSDGQFRAAYSRGVSFVEEYLARRLDADCIAAMVNSPKMPCTFVLEPLQGAISYAEYVKALFNYLKQINSKEESR